MSVSLCKSEVVIDELAVAYQTRWTNDIVAVPFEEAVVYSNRIWPRERTKVIDELAIVGRQWTI